MTYNHPSDIDKSCFVNFVNTTTDEVKQVRETIKKPSFFLTACESLRIP